MDRPVALVVFACLVVAGIAQKEAPWKFRCTVADKCVRVEQQSEEFAYGSLALCRLLCGQYGPLWPKPTGNVSLGQRTAEINPWNVKFDATGVPALEAVRKILNETKRYFLKTIRDICGRECRRPDNVTVRIVLKVDTKESRVTWFTSERYRLDILTVDNLITVTIDADTIFGARHAFETLTQLVASVTYENVNALALLTEVTIEDKPIFPHRGFMLDTARNFIPLSAIRRQIDGMAASKMNVLHWHISDTQSFPLEINSYPQITRLGAYSESEVYQQDDVLALVEYAKNRGIRCIFEFDAPAHAGNGWQWGPTEGMGNLSVCVNEWPWRQRCIEPPCGQLNPVNPQLYDVLQEVFNEFANLTGEEEIFHMGGDEVFFPCWNSSQEIIDYLTENGRGREEKDFLDLWSTFQGTALQLWDTARRRSNDLKNRKTPLKPVVLWSSHLTDPAVIQQYLPQNRYVIQTWVESHKTLPQELLDLGYGIIISTKDAWYLDHGFWGVTTYYGWRKVYDNKLPLVNGVLGGEACIWTEFIDEYALDSRTWPRLAAVAERLWSNPSTGANKAVERFNRHRQRLIERGIKPEAVTPQWCEQNEGQCN